MSAVAIATHGLHQVRLLMESENLDVCILSDPVHVAYVSGMFPPKGRWASVVVTHEEATLITPRAPSLLPATMVAAPYEDYSINYDVDVAANFAAAFASVTGRLGRLRRVGLEPAYLAVCQWQALENHGGPLSSVDISPRLRAARMAKHPSEVTAIERTEALADAMYTAIAHDIHVGSSEADVRAAVERVLWVQEASWLEVDGDFVSGPRTEGIGGPPTGRVLGAGDLLIVDLFPRLDTHCADLCRTYVVGQPTQAMLDRHAILVEALEAGEQAIRPGLPARELYYVVRGCLERHGLAAYFPHHAGHGVGLAPSEEPRIIPGSNHVLQEGMVITLEPGVYIPGEGGMRIEDNFLVTANGCRRLNSFPRRLTVLADE